MKEIEEKNSWTKFEGQRLETGDIVVLKENGLAFIDSSMTTKEPDRLTSIPEEWSFGADVAVNKRFFDEYGSAYISENGWIYREKKWGGDAWDKILFAMRLGIPEMANTKNTPLKPNDKELSAKKEKNEYGTEGMYVLRLFDMFDGWIDIEDSLTKAEANLLWNQKTANGTKNTCFDDGDYYKIFPSDTKMFMTPERLGR